MKELNQSRKTRYTQMVLRDSLVELMKEKPISKITIKELCANADINRTTFYAHYTDQYDLLRHIEEEALSWCKNMLVNFSVESGKEERIKNLEIVFNYFSENRNHIQVLMSEQGDIDFQKKLVTMLYEQFGMFPNENGTDLVTGELYFVFAISGSVGLIQHWLKNGLNKSAKELAEIIYNMTLNIR